MSDWPLIAEFNRAFIAAIRKRKALDRWMLGQGVPASICALTEMRYCAARIEAGGRFFEFAEDGPDGKKPRDTVRAIIVPEGARRPRLDRGIEVQCWAAMPDIVAFDYDDPSRWWRRRGDIDVLGQGALWDTQVAPDPDEWLIDHERAGRKRLSAAAAKRTAMPALKLYKTPLSWLAGGCQGCCLIDRDIDPRHVFAGVGRIDCEDAALAHHIQTRIARYARIAQPEIGVMGSSRPEADSPSSKPGSSRPEADSPSSKPGSSRPATEGGNLRDASSDLRSRPDSPSSRQGVAA